MVVVTVLTLGCLPLPERLLHDVADLLISVPTLLTTATVGLLLTKIQGKIQTVIVMYLGLSANNQDFLQLKIGLAMDKEIDIWIMT